MTRNKAIAMIDEYLLEPSHIQSEWVEVLMMCKKALEESGLKEAEIFGLWAENDILREKAEMTHIGLVTAKRKGWKKWKMEDQSVSGYPLIIGDKCYLYNKAKMNPYGTIAIDEYVEVDADTIGVKADGTI